MNDYYKNYYDKNVRTVKYKYDDFNYYIIFITEI